MGNKGLGSSSERGRNLVPAITKEEKVQPYVARYAIQTFTTSCSRRQRMVELKLCEQHFGRKILPFIGPPIKITALIIVFPADKSFVDKKIDIQKSLWIFSCFHKIAN